MTRIGKLFAMFLALVTVMTSGVISAFAEASDQAAAPRSSEHGGFVKKADYLFDVTYNDYDWKYAEKWMESDNKPKTEGKAFGCTSVHNGNFYGRSFDFCYNNMCEFMVRTPHTSNRFASLGMAISNCNMTEDVVTGKNGKKMDETDVNLLPFTVVDGINEKGVVCNANVVPSKDLPANSKDGKYHTSGTNPMGEPLFYQFVVRYILDNAESAEQAVQLLREKNITACNSKGEPIDYIGLNGMGYELHWMIADEKDTYIVEVVNNELLAMKNVNHIMTNSYNSCMTDSGAGLERYKLVRNQYDQTATKNGMMNVVKQLQYSKAYYVETGWWTEFTHLSLDDGTVLTVFNIDEEFTAARHRAEIIKALENAQHVLENKDRSHGMKAPWISVHSEVFDIANRKIYLMTQERYGDVYEYTLNADGKNDG